MAGLEPVLLEEKTGTSLEDAMTFRLFMAEAVNIDALCRTSSFFVVVFVSVCV